MIRGGRRALIGAALLVLAACLELGAPKGLVVSISSLRLPSPSVVAGDLMRDSLGNPSPVSLTAFGPDGEPLPTEPLTFIALDTTVSVDADGTVHGLFRDSIGGRVIGGAGALQTPPQRIIVTIAPTLVTKGPDATIQFVNTAPDTSAQTNWSAPLVLTVTGAGNAPAQAYVVTYSLLETPDPVTPGTPTAYISDAGARTMMRDTTDTKGIASRIVVLRQAAVAADVRSGSRVDSVRVQATVKYLGADIPGSPVQFVVPVSLKPPA
jgi:hypothetical protein